MASGDGLGGGSRDGVQNQAMLKMKTPCQIDALEKAYAVTSRPPEQMRLELAEETGLSSREISMWFANKRFQGKQAVILKDRRREGENDCGLGLAASSYMDSAMNKVAAGERSSKLNNQPQQQQMMPQPQASHYALDTLVVNYVERKLGGLLRDDGPPLGINFDPLTPAAFEAPVEEVAECSST